MSSKRASVRTLGLWRATSLVVGNIIGTGIFLLPASLGAFGTLGLLGWVVTSLGSICLAMMFSRLSHQFPQTGGPYAYSREAFGDFVGFQMAWSYWVSAWAGNAAIATAFVSYSSHFWPALSSNSMLSFALACAAVWFFTFLNSVSVRTAGIVQIIIVAFKVVPLSLIAFFGVFYIDFDNYLIVNPSGLPWFRVIAASSALTLYAFLGLESATIPAENVLHPDKTIPKATLLGTAFSAFIYIWTTIVLLGLIPSGQISKSNAPFADAALIIFGDYGAALIAICATLSAFGTLNGWILLQGQMPYAAAHDRLFPKAFGRLSRFGTPAFSLIFGSVLMTGVLYLNYGASLVDQFTSIVTLTAFTSLLPYLYSAAADLKFLLSGTSIVPKARIRRSLIVTSLAFAYTVLIVFGSGQEAVYLGMLFVFLGFPLYALMTPKPSKT